MTEEQISSTAASGLFEVVLDHLSIPIVVVKANGTLVYANRSARIVIGDHLLPMAVDGIQFSTHEQADRRIKAAIADACASQIGQAVELGQSKRCSTAAFVVPFGGDQPAETNHAMVLLSVASDTNVRLLDLLRHRFKLSLTEAKVAVALSTGANLKQIAHERDVKLSTLRTQLASIMEKMEIHRQSALVAFVTQIKCLF